MVEKEYIEREALIRYAEKQEFIIKDGTSVADAMRIQGNVFRRCVETCPAADVAPKSEVAREIFEEIETLLCRSVYPRVNANGTITPITSKDWHIRCDDYDAIKKKYTEE